MNKREILLVLIMLFTMYMQAKDRTIVVRGKGVNESIKTVVTSCGNDTLKVDPGREVEFLSVTLKDFSGNILFFQCVSVCFEDHFTIISPESGCYFLEVKDDRGYVYKEIDN